MLALLSALFAERTIEAGLERRATWLELFFDLVFAAAVGETAGLLNEGHGLTGLAAFLAFFVLTWWAWTGHTMFSTRFDSDDTGQRVLTGCQMFLVAVMAANAHPDLNGREAAGFAASYGGMRVLLALQYARATGNDPTGTLARRCAAAIGLAAVFWIGSSLVSGSARLPLLVAAVAVELAGPTWATRRIRLPLHRSHVPERFGLFTLIMLGELVASMMRGIRAQQVWSPAAAGAAILGLGFAFVLWWFYFSFLRVSDPADGPESLGTLRLAAHLPLSLGIVVAGAAIQQVVASAGVSPLPSGAGWLLGGSLVAVVGPMVLFAIDRRSPEPEVLEDR